MTQLHPRPWLVDISLQNRGTDTVKVEAVGFPGDVPRNAKQLFYPAEFDAMFQSKKYRPSRGNDSRDLYIDNLEITQPRGEGTPKQIAISTGDNGGYLNLVNPNFKIFRNDYLTMSYHDSKGELKEYPVNFIIDIHNPQNATFSYAVYLDYFNTEELDGVRPDDHTYNFVHDQPTQHDEELIESKTAQNGTRIVVTYTPEHHLEVRLQPGATRKTRLRIVVKQGDEAVAPRQDEIFNTGEVEDYLIEIGVPDCAQLIPEAYKLYAADLLAFCNEYPDGKGGPGRKRKRDPDKQGIAFVTDSKKGQKYAKTKAVSSWYESKAAFEAGTKMSSPPVAPDFSGTFDPNWFSVADDLQEIDPGQQTYQNLMMDIYYPEAEEGATLDDLSALPVIIYLPGGAFAWNMRQTELTEKTCQWLASRGYVVAAIDYRVGIHVDDSEVAKRAMIRAWQDSRAAVKWWGMPQNRTRSATSGHPIWKIDPERIYTVGHGAGGVTALHNLHLYPALLDAETGTEDTPGSLWTISGGYTLNGTDTYDLRQYPTIPCITLSDGTNTCDLTEHNPADPANGYFAVPGGEPLAVAALSQYRALDGRAKESVSLAGGILETDWLTDALNTPGPSLLIHHEDDAVISNQTAAMDVRNNGDIIAADVATLSGGAAMYADWNAAASDKGTLLWLELDNDDAQTGGGGGSIWPYHPVLMEEGEDYDAYIAGEASLSLDEALLYYIDVFFMKNWSAGTSTRLATQEVPKPATLPEAEDAAREAFQLFPNPASDQVNIIVTVKESGPLEVAFTNMQGRRVYHYCADYVASGTQWVRLGDLNLAGGTYIVDVKATGLTKQQKLIIDKK